MPIKLTPLSLSPTIIFGDGDICISRPLSLQNNSTALLLYQVDRGSIGTPEETGRSFEINMDERKADAAWVFGSIEAVDAVIESLQGLKRDMEKETEALPDVESASDFVAPLY